MRDFNYVDGKKLKCDEEVEDASEYKQFSQSEVNAPGFPNN